MLKTLIAATAFLFALAGVEECLASLQKISQRQIIKAEKIMEERNEAY